MDVFWATPTLVMVNIAVFAAMALSTRRLGFDPVVVFNWGGNLGSMTVAGQWWRLLTAVFVHLYLLHLLLNMWALWNVGRLAERFYGSGAFVFLYLASGVLGNLASVAWDPSKISAGASGAIFGILGAYLAFLAHPDSRLPRQVIRTHWISTLIFVLFNLVNGAFNPLIDNAATCRRARQRHHSRLDPGPASGRPVAARVPVPQGGGGAAGAGSRRARGPDAGARFRIRLSASEQFTRTHLWYIRGEEPNLMRWQELAIQLGSGTISEADAGTGFEREIVPFWEMADARLAKEAASLRASDKSYVSQVAEFSRLRLKWARTIVRATKDRDASAERELMPLMRQTDVVVAHLERIQLRDSMSHRSRALAESGLSRQVRALFSRRPECVARPLGWGPRVAPTDAPGDGPAARTRAGCQAQQMFLAGDYVSLEDAMNRAVRSLGDLPDGGSSFDGIGGGLYTLFLVGGYDLQSTLARTAAWRRALPGSINAELVEVEAFEAWAWTARGSGTADQVAQQSWMLFAHRTEMAAEGLRELGQRAANHPLWYDLSLTIGLDESLDADGLRAIFDRGIAKFPDYRALEHGMLRLLMPRWSGSYEKVDAFVNSRARRQDGSLDLETYARLYWIYDSLEGDDTNLFETTQAKWPSMKEGFSLMASRHPSSDFVANGFARFACLGGDAQQFRALRARLATHYSATAWSKNVTRESCDRKFGIQAAAAGK